MKILCFKLITGEELIAQIDSEDDEWLTVVNPVSILQTIYDGKYILSFTEFMNYNEEMLFTFKQKHVITSIIPSEEVIKYYTQFLLGANDVESLGTFH